MALEFREWWRPADRDRPWVRLIDIRGREAFLGWWDLRRTAARGDAWEAPPVIEVLGVNPPEGGVALDLPGEVETAGWWVLAGFTPEEAPRWIDAGVEDPRFTLGWASFLDMFTFAFDLDWRYLLGVNRAKQRLPTEEGFEIISLVTARGVDARTVTDTRHQMRKLVQKHCPDVFARYGHRGPKVD